jgi:hypothetical protein
MPFMFSLERVDGALDGFSVWVTDEPNENETLCHCGRLDGASPTGRCVSSGGRDEPGRVSLAAMETSEADTRDAARSRQWGRPSIHRSAGR